MPLGKRLCGLVSTTKKLEAFIKHSRWSSQSTVSYYYGFPCYVKDDPRQGYDNVRAQIIEPLLIFGVDLVETETGPAFVLQPDRPRINSSFLADKDLLTSSAARKRVAEAILESWDEEKSRSENLRTALSAFSELLPPEVTFSENILDGKTVGLTGENGIVPLGVIFRSTGSPYTRGLEQELKQLRGSTRPNGIWSLIIERNAELKKDNEDPVLAITELNDEQRSAVRSALNNTMTVVTGPPGTGKSQVVLNMIINALSRNRSVLFGSKNHKAVDVVIERLTQIQSEPVILKYGAIGGADGMSKEVEFVETLLSAIDRASSYNPQTLKNEIQAYRQELEFILKREQEAQQSLSRIGNRQNHINQLDAELESLQKELPTSIASNLFPYRAIRVEPEFRKTLNLLAKLVKEIDNGRGIKSQVLMLFGFSLEKRTLKVAQILLDLVPIEGTKITLNSVDNCRELLAICYTLEKWIRTQHELLECLKETENEVQMEVLRERITQSKERAVKISAKYIDALMKGRLRSIEPKRRTLIVDYLSTVKRLERDMTGGRVTENLSYERKRIFKGIVDVFPAIAVTNLSVRNALPLNRGVVDTVIIDEASQCDIASAIPLIYRARRAVIVGDNNQLQHISSLHATEDQQLQRNTGLDSGEDQRFLYSINSLFDLGRSVVLAGAKFVHLLEHYRSRAEIIGFSNEKFYSGKLSVWTDYKKLRGSGSPNAIAWHDVVGRVVRPPSGSAHNLDEARAVVALIEETIARIQKNGTDSPISLGVVTPFRAQANQITALIGESTASAHLRKLGFMVDTAHRYQGDERDVMIFSPVVSEGIQERSRGFLASTKNLFNVAITRARAELHIVGDKAACAQSGIQHLSDFVRYVEEQELNGEVEESGTFESPWEEILHNALERAGIKSVSQYRFDQYRLDLAIPDANPQIDIEIDGEAWHRDIDGSRMSSDLKRDQHLESRGWRVKRFWVYELRNDLDRCVREIKEMLE